MFSHLPTSKTVRTLAALACVGGAGQLSGADPLPPAAPAFKPVAISDVALASAVLKAFDADPVLKHSQILVSVVDRGALIGGPVRSGDLKTRAEAVARAVPGIVSVKNACFVEADPDLLLRAVADRMRPGPQPVAAALPGVAVPPTAADGFIPKELQQQPGELIADASSKTVVAQRMNALGAPVGVLGAPVLPRAATDPAPGLPPGAAAAPGALTGSTGARPDVLAAVAAIRAADPRFAKIAAELKPDGGVVVSGSVAKAGDAWDFAARVRKVPGVLRVVLDPGVVK